MSLADNTARRVGRRTDRVIWIAVGCLSLAVGAVGVVLPLLPTAPLVILAAFAFGKGSPRLQAALESSRLFGPIIADWRLRGAIAPRYKALAITMMITALTASILAAVSPFVIAVQMICLTLAGTYILTRPNGGKSFHANGL